MKITKAARILPASLLSAIQEYAQGELLYIPKKSGTHQKWGSGTNSRVLIQQRNASIRQAFGAGTTIDYLSEQYFLSVDTIKRIVYSKQ